MNVMGFLDHAAPEPEGMGFVQHEIEPAGDGAPFVLHHLPGFLRGSGKFLGSGTAGAPGRSEIRDLVFDERAEQAQVVARTGVEAAAAFGIPTGDAFLVFGHAVEVDFLGALHNPILEDAVAARRNMALHRRGVGVAALEGFGDDAGVATERVGGAQSGWIAQFAGNACGENEADAANAGEQGVRSGG